PFGCTYCQPTLRRLFGPKLRMRSPENVVAELAELKARYGVDGVFFHDDTLTARREWVLEFCDRLERERLSLLWACNTRANTLDEALMRRMHSAGLRNIHLGIESGCERILRDVYRKGIEPEEVRGVVDCAKRVGVTVLGFFMLGAPTETASEVERTIRFARSLRLDEATFAITSPLPGTYLHDRIAGDGYRMSANLADFDYYSHRAFEDPKLPYAKLKLLHLKALLLFYLHPYRWRYILRHLVSVAGWRKLIQKVRRYA
ncbi:MAG: radical SAM protein, partial [Planctomycetes bacterium]|nr:radical SAM protein [Planctomycetota bacterium]